MLGQGSRQDQAGIHHQAVVVKGDLDVVRVAVSRVNYRGRTHEQCVEQTKVMFQAAKEAGVRRIVHISITNPDPISDLPYFRGKGQLEDALRDLGVSYAILRPTVLYSTEDILLNNIAWTVRKFPVVLLPGNGHYGIQPEFVEDLACLAVECSQSEENIELDAVGSEVFTYAQLVRLNQSQGEMRRRMG